MPVAVTVIITLALVFYTVGVWSERFQGRLRPWWWGGATSGSRASTAAAWSCG